MLSRVFDHVFNPTFWTSRHLLAIVSDLPPFPLPINLPEAQGLQSYLMVS